MPFGFGGGPWWAYNNSTYRNTPRYGGRCFRFPWLPRWWWANPGYSGQPYPEQPYPAQPSTDQELNILQDEATALKQELKNIEDRISELSKKKK